jgi:hypothetical protein
MAQTACIFTIMEKDNEIKPVGIRDEKGRFLKGSIANPTGRPKKGTALADVMRDILETEPDLKNGIIRVLLEGARRGDIAFIREVLDRIDGRPTVTADIHNTGEVVVVPDEVYKKYGTTQDTEDSGGEQGEIQGS